MAVQGVFLSTKLNKYGELFRITFVIIQYLYWNTVYVRGLSCFLIYCAVWYLSDIKKLDFEFEPKDTFDSRNHREIKYKK
jgi:hypothetical protein